MILLSQASRIHKHTRKKLEGHQETQRRGGEEIIHVACSTMLIRNTKVFTECRHEWWAVQKETHGHEGFIGRHTYVCFYTNECLETVRQEETTDSRLKWSKSKVIKVYLDRNRHDTQIGEVCTQRQMKMSYSLLLSNFSISPYPIIWRRLLVAEAFVERDHKVGCHSEEEQQVTNPGVGDLDLNGQSDCRRLIRDRLLLRQFQPHRCLRQLPYTNLVTDAVSSILSWKRANG